MKLLRFLPALVFFCAGLRAEDTAPGADRDSPYEQIKTLTRAMELIRQDYVDGKKIGYEQLMRAALKGMLQSLDPHSQFMEPANFEDMKEDTESRFGGLGVHVSERNGELIVVSPMEDSPGFRAGLLPGDKIIKIDGQSAERLDLNGAIEKLRGAAGTKVTLTILRPGTKEIKDFAMVRETIKVWSVKDAKLLPPELAGQMKIGYARITQFNAPTAEELAKKLDELEKKGMQALVLDLRFNPGGLLNSAVDIAGMFLPAATVVATTEGRVASQSRKYTANPALRRRANYPLAVLINNGSASGSEIVAGALKDTNRAILVGETTFGKGSVQSIMQLPDGSALRLTTAKYYTPGHQVIHEHGVAPTILAPMSAEQERALIIQRREDLPDEQRKKDLANFRDTQLDRAVDALKGVLVYAQRSGGQSGAVIILALETSCDETAAAVLRDGVLLSSEVASQIALHALTGGVVPEVASRNHLRLLRPVIERALQRAGVTLPEMDFFAATRGPGLASSLMIGLSAAKGMAVGLRRPFVAVNHLEAHLLSPFFGRGEVLPAVGLVVSGGHTLLVEIVSVGKYRLLGKTQDDAAGEAFDKVGKLLGLPYPGGPNVNRLAGEGDATRFAFPRSMLSSGDFAFSFSGLKTSVRYLLQKMETVPVADVCASFQEAVVDVLVEKTIRAAVATKRRTIAVSGGVSCNSRLREKLAGACACRGIDLLLAEPSLCTDNAAMIGYVATLRMAAGEGSALNEDIDPNLPLLFSGACVGIPRAETA